MSTTFQESVTHLDLAAVRKSSGDDKARKVCLAAVKRADRLAQLRNQLCDIRHAVKAAETLRDEGIKIPDALLTSGVFQFKEASRVQLQEHVWQEICRVIADDVSADLKRCLRDTVAKLQADLEAVEQNARAISGRYGIEYVRPNVALSLQHAIDFFQDEIFRPFDVSWNHSIKAALNCHFNPHL